MKYTGLPGAGAGILNAGSCPAGTGVPLAASRAHELAGLVTPGKAVNGKRCVVAPVSCRVPVKEMSPGMAFRFAAVPVPLAGLALPAEDGLALPDEGAAAGEEAAGEEAEDVLEPVGRVAPPDGEPEELQAARAAVSSRPAAAARPRARVGWRITRTAGTWCGDCMKGSLGLPRIRIRGSFARFPAPRCHSSDLGRALRQISGRAGHSPDPRPRRPFPRPPAAPAIRDPRPRRFASRTIEEAGMTPAATASAR